MQSQRAAAARHAAEEKAVEILADSAKEAQETADSLKDKEPELVAKLEEANQAITRALEPLEYSLWQYAIAKNYATQLIDGMIDDSKNVLGQIDAGEDYDEMAKASSVDSYLRMINILSLPTKLEPAKRQYPFIEIMM